LTGSLGNETPGFLYGLLLGKRVSLDVVVYRHSARHEKFDGYSGASGGNGGERWLQFVAPELLILSKSCRSTRNLQQGDTRTGKILAK
jgi:hypothetical protein